MTADTDNEDEIKDRTTPVVRRGRRWWLILLAMPYLGLCFPQIYTRTTPTLWGFPFFYWYQFGWVLLTSGLLAVVYLALLKTRDS